MAASLKDAGWAAGTDRLDEQYVRLPNMGLPRSQFHCRLDDQPDHLVPERYLRPRHWEAPAGRQLFVNPECFFNRNGDTSTSLSSAFTPSGDMVWVKDPANGILQPFWLAPEVSMMLSGVDPGDPAPSTLSPGAVETLCMASVLVPGDYSETRQRQWKDMVTLAGAEFRQRGYVPLGSLIHHFHVAAMRRYYRHLIRGGKLNLGDQQSSRRYVAHNESVARFFHLQLTSAISSIAGEGLKPSYVYLASYQPGAMLEKHTDREQCEFSLTMCIDYSPEPTDATPWPLQLHTPSGMVTVYQAIGDALLYRGRQLPHSRNRLREEHTSTSIFFHYVRENFNGGLD